jgi:hypothetical protein
MRFLSFFRCCCCCSPFSDVSNPSQHLLSSSVNDVSAAEDIRKSLIKIVNGTDGFGNQLALSTAKLFNDSALQEIDKMSADIRKIDEARLAPRLNNKIERRPHDRSMSFNTGAKRSGKQDQVATEAMNDVYAGAGQSKSESGKDRASAHLLLVRELELRLTRYKLTIRPMEIRTTGLSTTFFFRLIKAYRWDSRFIDDSVIIPLDLVYSVIKHPDTVTLQLKRLKEDRECLADSSNYTIPALRSVSVLEFVSSPLCGKSKDNSY